MSNSSNTINTSSSSSSSASSSTGKILVIVLLTIVSALVLLSSFSPSSSNAINTSPSSSSSVLLLNINLNEEQSSKMNNNGKDGHSGKIESSNIHHHHQIHRFISQNYLRPQVFKHATKKCFADYDASMFVEKGKQLCILLLLGFGDQDEQTVTATELNSPNNNCHKEFYSSSSSSMTVLSSIMKNETLSLATRAKRMMNMMLLKCISRVGVSKFEKALNPKCTTSKWWKKMIVMKIKRNNNKEMDESESSSSSDNIIPQDYTRQAQIRSGQRKYIPPSRRTYAISSSSTPFVEFSLPSQYSSVVATQKTTTDSDTTTTTTTTTKKRPILRAYPISFGLPKKMILSSSSSHQDKGVSRFKFLSFNPITASWLGGKKNYARIPRDVNQANTKNPFLKYSMDSDEEHTLAQLYRHSYFGYTMIRGGSDAQRHLEIMARGCVPYFPDLEFRCFKKDSTCLALYPRELMIEVLDFVKKQPATRHWSSNRYENEFFARGKVWLNVKKLPTIVMSVKNEDNIIKKEKENQDQQDEAAVRNNNNNNQTKQQISSSSFDEDRYFDLADRFLKFTRDHLSCAAIVSYMLKIAGNEEPKNVFVFVPSMGDYLSLCIEQGFAELGINYTTNDHFSFGLKESTIQNLVPSNDDEDVVVAVSSSSVGEDDVKKAKETTSDDNTNQHNNGGDSINHHNNRHNNNDWPLWEKKVNSSTAKSMSFSDWSKIIKSSDLNNNHGIDSLYGRGFVWGMRVDPPPNPRQPLIDNHKINKKNKKNRKSTTLQKRIENKEFDLIIYSALFLFKEGRFHSSVSKYLPYLRTVHDAYRGEWNKVVFVDGDDYPLKPEHWGGLFEEMVMTNNDDHNNKNDGKMKSGKSSKTSSSSSSSSTLFVRESFHLDKKHLETGLP